MTRERYPQLFSVGLLMVSATLGCNAASPLQRPPAVASERVAALNVAPESAPMELSFSFSSGEPSELQQEESSLDFGAEGRTVIAVDQDTISDSSDVLRFTPAKRGQETIGVRVFFEVGEEDGDDETYLGLRRADRIEEVDGLAIAALSTFLEAWQGIGRKPEVRLLLNRAGHSHTVIYRRRSSGTARRY
ncbi:MAG: hypothetical protein RL033_5611 [Pseudomonadota bacterium]|jgi:hypothetical protein